MKKRKACLATARQRVSPILPIARHALLLPLVLVAHSVFAADPLDKSVQVNIPTGTPLDLAVIQLGEQITNQTGMHVMLASNSVGQQTTEGLRGTLPAKTALTTLLRGSGLSYEVSDNTVSVVPTTQSPSETRPTSSASKREFDNNKRQLIELEEVVVTAQKREERLQNVPISISVLGGKDLDKSSFQGVTDTLNTVAGVSTSVSSQSGGTQIVIRGVGPAAPTQAGASTVAYYIDSVPFGFVKQAILPDPNVFDLQRIEVLRGPQGTLYGANAENGVVRVLTNDANPNAFELKARTLLSTTDGGGGNYGGDMAINVPVIEGKLAVRAVVDYQNLSGWINSPVDDHVNDAQLRSYRLKINAQPTNALSMGLSAWSTHDNYGAPPTSTDARTISAVIPEPISTNYDAYAFKFGYEFHSFSLSSATSDIDYSNKGILDLGIYGAGFGPLHGFPVFANFGSKVFSEELILDSAPNSSWHWTAGAFYRDGRDHRPITIPGILPAPVDWSYASHSYAVFGQLGRRFLNDHLEWTLGLRYFHDNVLTKENVQGQGLANVPLIRETASFNSTTPRAVLTWYPNREWTVYGSFSEGFRSGSPQDPGVIEVAPNFPPLKPDKLYNYEVGAKADLLDRRLSLDAAFYYIDWRDIQQAITVPIGHNISLLTLLNSKSAKGPGVDLAVTTRPLDGLELGVTFGWNNLTMAADVLSGGNLLFAKGDRLDYSPEFTAGASAAYTFPIGGEFSGRFSVSGNYTSKQTDHLLNGAFGRVAFNTGDDVLIARTELSLMSSTRWRATLFVDNVTNSYGAIPAFGFDSPELQPRPRPRTIGVQFDYRLWMPRT